MYEERYTQIPMYENYLLDLDLQQKEMTRYVNECIALSNPDKKQAISELAILNEGKIGDKFKKVWARIKSFFSKIYQKFLESLAAWSNDNQEYLKQYYNVIFEKKVTIKSVKMQDHYEGRKRINKMIENASKFTEVPDMTALMGGENGGGGINKAAAGVNDSQENADKGVNTYATGQQTAIIKSVFGDEAVGTIVDGEDPSAYASKCRNYLNGGEEIQSFTTSEIQDNMEYMYNFLYRVDNIVEGLKKIKENYEKGMDNIETSYKKGFNAITTKYKNMSDADRTTAAEDLKNGTENSALGKEMKSNAAEIKKVDDELKKNQAPQNAGYVYSTVYGSVVNEADIVNGSNNNTTTDTTKASGEYNGTKIKTLDQQSSKDSKSLNTSSNATKKNMSPSKNIASGAGKQAAAGLVADKDKTEEMINRYQDTAIEMLRAYGNARSLLLGATLNALTDTRRDYFDIVRAHIRSWLGQTEGPNQEPDSKPKGNAQI